MPSVVELIVFMAKCVTEHEIESLNETISHTTAEYKNERHADLKRKLKNSRHYRQTHKSEQSNWVKNLLACVAGGI